MNSGGVAEWRSGGRGRGEADKNMATSYRGTSTAPTAAITPPAPRAGAAAVLITAAATYVPS